jgi:hypothetical protein
LKIGPFRGGGGGARWADDERAESSDGGTCGTISKDEEETEGPNP